MTRLAKSFAATGWTGITSLYNHLRNINSNPFIELNDAIALYYAGEITRGLAILHSLEAQPFFNQYYLLHASLGRIYSARGNYGLAKEYFIETIQLTSSLAEKHFIQRLMGKLLCGLGLHW